MRRFPFAILALALVTSCAPVPDLGARPQPVAGTSLASQASFGMARGDWPVDHWWIEFGDTQLSALIEKGLSQSPDIAAAAARIRSADALAQQAGAALVPSFTIDGSAGGTKQSENLGIPPQFVPKGVKDTGQVTAQLSFNLDMWGRNRAALAAARGEAEAARVDAAQVRLLLATSIAAAYADLAQYQAERDVARDALQIRTDTARLTAQRVAVGVDTLGAKAQADAKVPQARADLSALDEAIALTRNRLASLVGAGPDYGLTITRPRLNASDRDIPANAGIDLVGRRPDIVAARLRAEAAAARIKVARADFYPNINLSALVGLQSLGLSNLMKSGSTYGNGGIAFSLPILDAGRIQGRFRGARAAYDAAVATYDSTLIAALREVADAAASRTRAKQRVVDLMAAVTSAREASRIATLRYRAGLSNQLPVLTADDTLLAVERALADAEARRFAIDVALIRALGGGYRSAANPEGRDNG